MLYKLDLPPSKYRYIKKLAITYIALWVNRCIANPTREPNQLSITQVLININIKRDRHNAYPSFCVKIISTWYVHNEDGPNRGYMWHLRSTLFDRPEGCIVPVGFQTVQPAFYHACFSYGFANPRENTVSPL